MTKPARILLKDDNRAEVGIGTMIVFIATILVAAVAAGVLISTSQKLQSKSQQTGSEAIANVAGALQVTGITGVRSGTTSADLIDQLDINIKLSAGADPVDLSKLVVDYNDGTNHIVANSCEAGGAVTASTEFATTKVTGSGSDCGVMGSGDLFTIHLGLAGATPIYVDGDDGIEAATRVSVSLIPNQGQTSTPSFTTPQGFGSNTYITLQ